MTRSVLLLVDAIVNLLLGLLLLFYPKNIITCLGIPFVENAFYPSILGAVIFGIGIALLIELIKKNEKFVGLGLGGAITINIIGALVLVWWLLFGNLNLSSTGLVVLWSVAAVVLVIGIVELFYMFTKSNVR
jgi:hypothetical protein